ncbi:uncharacterized protein LOC117335948 [Pecten maximus]|uniref:uncharacterized protein LOC117335948 n=1 Tax=Pecten maximus TaxID=6579 RepID=UPI001458AB0D|nr:uncharacterized protein LOC117335948 [Pecten maximus]
MDSATPHPMSAKSCTEPGHTALVSAWCQICRTFVCIQGMVSEKHAGHIFISLEKIVDGHQAEIDQKKIEMRKIEESLGAELLHQLEIETKFNARVDDLNNEIDKRSQRLHSDIESWKTKTKSALQTRVEEIRIPMKVRQDQIKEDQNKLRAALDQCSLENYKTSLVMADEAIQVKRQSSVYFPACLILTEGSSSELDMDTLLGHISDEESYGSDCVSDIKPNSFTGSDNTSDLHGLSKTERNSTKDLNTDRIYFEASPDDVEILKVCQFKDPNQQGDDIKLAASRDGVQNGCRIKKKTYFNWKTFVKTEPLQTFGIGITSADDILVCLQGIDYAEIVKFSPTGNRLQSIRLDEDKKEIFHRPRHVLEVIPTEDVLIIDEKTVITLDTDGKVKNTWRGDLDDEVRKDRMTKFQSISIAVNSEGDLFVLDQGNRRIIVFDKAGEKLSTMHDNVMLKRHEVCSIRHQG